jgi:hypothetical protein
VEARTRTDVPRLCRALSPDLGGGRPRRRLGVPAGCGVAPTALEEPDAEPTASSKQRVLRDAQAADRRKTRLAEESRTGCARCGSFWGGTLKESRAVFRKHRVGCRSG